VAIWTFDKNQPASTAFIGQMWNNNPVFESITDTVFILEGTTSVFTGLNLAFGVDSDGVTITAGTVTKISLFSGRVVGTDLDVSAVKLQDLIDADNSFAAAQNAIESYMLRGNDRITGSDVSNGNFVMDTLYGFAGNDVISSRAGSDTIDGGNGNDKLFGGSEGDALKGGRGNDDLNGGAGSDTLFGGAGRDDFIFDAPLMPIGVDSIRDINVRQDRIILDNDVFVGLARGRLKDDAFVKGYEATTDDHRIIYDNGYLFFDADGNGNASDPIVFASFIGIPNVTASDFFVIG
jgi:Ca2+-binding RTX toxin-like protein